LEGVHAHALEDDLIRVRNIDHFARSVKEFKIMIDDLQAKGVSVEFVSENITLTHNTADNLYVDVLLSVLGSIYEFERKMVLIRQAEGIANAKESGKYNGRKCILNTHRWRTFRNASTSACPRQNSSRFMRGSFTYFLLRGAWRFIHVLGQPSLLVATTPRGNTSYSCCIPTVIAKTPRCNGALWRER
jgi:hypothetical protein